VIVLMSAVVSVIMLVFNAGLAVVCAHLPFIMARHGPDR
jgi:hypothetical protein